jgi:hypothetical protein
VCSFHAPATFDIDENDNEVVLLEGRDGDAAVVSLSARAWPVRWHWTRSWAQR